MNSNLRISRSRFVPVHAFLNNTRERRPGLDSVIAIAAGFFSLLICLLVYLGIWGVLYRIPPSPTIVVDTRIDKAKPPLYVAICAALAANEHGFPGHAYVAWSNSLPVDLTKTDSLGFVPLRAVDQIPSLWQRVPGIVVSNAAYGNLRNVTAVVAIVDRKTFEYSKEKSRSWKSDKFKVGSSDCVAFANSIAESIGLTTPDTSCKYPQDYLEQLKELNKQAAEPNKGDLLLRLEEESSRQSLVERTIDAFCNFRMKFAGALRSVYDLIVSKK